MAIHRLTIPCFTPYKTNDWLGRHWSVKHRMREETTELIQAYGLLQSVPRATQRRRVNLVVSGWPKGRLPDKDAFWKLLLDSLVHAGLLVDDGPDFCDPGDVEIVRSRERRTVIELIDLQPLATRTEEKP